MIDQGLIEETKLILEKGYDKKLNSLNTVGYKEIISYLNNEINFETAVKLIKRNTRRYAKRQLTWFRADDRIVWFDVESQKDIQNIADKIIRLEDLNERKN
jgi:tRNA dimethylallyltransferase